MTTRALTERYRAILAQVARLGEATHAAIEGQGSAVTPLGNMLQGGYLEATRIQEIRGGRIVAVNSYKVTEKGLSALESGRVANAEQSANSLAWNRHQFGRRAKEKGGCVHHWIIGPPPLQHHTCKFCPETKDQPFTFSGDMAHVGGGRVTKSERFG